MKWFRLYTEARTDCKLRALTPEQFRVWFNLLCYAAEQVTRGVVTPVTRTLLAVEVADQDVELLDATVDKLVMLNIVTVAEDGTITFLAFAERQYESPSDAPEQVKARVAKHRRAKRNEQVTTTKRHGNDKVTSANAPDTEADTDTETEGGRDARAHEAIGDAAHDPTVIAVRLPDGSVVKNTQALVDAFLKAAGLPTDLRAVMLAWIETHDGMCPSAHDVSALIHRVDEYDAATVTLAIRRMGNAGHRSINRLKVHIADVIAERQALARRALHTGAEVAP